MLLDLFAGLAWIMAICAGLMAGTYLAFSVFIMKSLATLEPGRGIEAMNAINSVILRTAFMPLFFGSTVIAMLMVITGTWFWGAPGANRALTGGLIYFIGMFVTTAAANVPLNNSLATVTGDDAGAVGSWNHYRSRWTRWNSLRTVASIATLVICIDLLTN